MCLISIENEEATAIDKGQQIGTFARMDACRYKHVLFDFWDVPYIQPLVFFTI